MLSTYTDKTQRYQKAQLTPGFYIKAFLVFTCYNERYKRKVRIRSES